VARKLSVLVLVLFGLALASELGFRLLAPRLGVDRARLDDYRSLLLHGRLKNFEPRAHTIFGRMHANSYGFADREWRVQKKPGVPRILCVGESTTEGSYPQELEALLQTSTGRDFEVLNAGVSGWCSAEMLVAWFLTLQDFAPDVLVFHGGVNDVHPRLRADFRPDYSHWRTSLRVEQACGIERWIAGVSDLYVQLRLRKVGELDIGTLTSTTPAQIEPLVKENRLPPETARPFRRNVACIADSARALGARVVFMTMPVQPTFSRGEVWLYGIDEHNRILIELAREHGDLLVDAARAFDERRDELGPTFKDIVHLTPEGNRVKAELVAQALQEDWVPTLPTEGSRPPR
jgi:lysophospholipase L1-like esterase